eukprot:Hpha_TRINITY_DN13453_c0_g1::TRINITY_DN13453_c0_g1_i1::g.131070::m.131070/K03627/MBF1; putative transcription factor
MSRFTPTGQDWAPVILGTKPAGKKGGGGGYSAGNPGESKFATRPGQHQAAGGLTLNQQHKSGPGLNQKKLADDTENLKHKKTTLDFRIHLQQARQAKGWSQKELAQQIQERDTMIKDYESGKAIPNGQFISKMERALGVHLRGASAGEPLQKKEPKAKPAAKPGGKKK